MKPIPPIDLDTLEEHLAEQEDLMGEAMEELAHARKAFEVEEAALEVIAADLSLKIRHRPKRYGLESVTEPAIKAVVIIQPEHKKQKYRIIKKKHSMGIMQARVTRLDHRKRGLEKLVDLLGQGYWSKPSLSRKGKKAMNRERIKKIQREIDDE